MAAAVRWPDEQGPWLITAHWAKVDDRPMIVGLDVRSFTDRDQAPVSDHLLEVTQRVLRGLPISRIRDLTRAQLIETAMLPSLGIRSIPIDGDESDMDLNWMDPEDVAAMDERAAAAHTLTAKGEPRKRRPAAGEDLLRRVAVLYAEAVGQGDTMPAKYVEEKLSEAGEPRLGTKGGRVLVRQWIRRARERGYLTVQSPRQA